MRPASPGTFCGWRSASLRNVEVEPPLTRDQRDVVFVFLQRNATWCVRTRRFAQAEGARDLYHRLTGAPLAREEQEKQPLPTWRQHLLRSGDESPKGRR